MATRLVAGGKVIMNGVDVSRLVRSTEVRHVAGEVATFVIIGSFSHDCRIVGDTLYLNTEDYRPAPVPTSSHERDVRLEEDGLVEQ